MSAPAGSDGPLVSILTPSFNQGRFLADCIGSVLHQTYRPLEQVISDGGSTDETLDTLRNAPATVQWVSEPDRGQSHALNKSFSRSRGEIIGWLNSDDAYFDTRAVECAVAAFSRFPDVDVIYGHAALVNAAGDLLHMMWSPPFTHRLHWFTNFIVQPTVFIRRSALGDRMVDELFDSAMDRELWLRLASRSRFKRLNLVMAIDRHQPQRKSHTRVDLAVADEDRMVERYQVRRIGTWRLLHKAYMVSTRFAALRLLPAAYGRHACRIQRPNPFGLLARQIILRRRTMSFGA